MKCWSLPNFFNREILLVMREMESWICTYAHDAGLPCTLHVVLLKWTMCILMARFNNVKNICVLKDFICQGGRPKNSRTCMLVGWGSRHFAAEAMELKVPDKVLICYFVLPTGVSIQIWQVWALINLLAVPEKVFTTGDDRQVHCDKSNDTQGFTVYILNYRVFLHGMSHIC